MRSAANLANGFGDEPPGTRRVGRNAAAGALRFAVSAGLALAVTPYALAQLGETRFGIWAIAGGVIAAARLLDLGVPRALTREVAMAGHDGQLRSTLETALGLALVSGAVVVAAIALLHGPILTFVGVPESLRAEAAVALIGSALVAALEGAFTPHAAALEGLGRLDLASGVDTVQRVLSAVGVVVVLASGWGLGGLVAKNAILALAAGLAYRLVLARSAPSLAGVAPRLVKEPARRLLAFGRHIQAVNLSALVIEPVNKLILGRGAGLEAVAFYELATLVVSQVGGAFMAAAQALYPEAARRTRHTASGNLREGLLELWRTAEFAIAVPALGAFAVLAALAGPFVSSWLGAGYGPVALAIAILAGGWAVAMAGLPAFLLAQGGGYQGLATRAGLITATLSVTTAVALAPVAGAAGVAVGRATGLAAGALAAWVLVARTTNRRAPNGGTIAGALAAALAGAGAARLAANLAEPAGLAGVVLSGILGMAVYGVIVVGAHLARREAPRAGRSGQASAAGLGALSPDRAIRHSDGADDCRSVAAVVPAWNALPRLPAVLAALHGRVDLIVVVNNGSDDGSTAWLEGWVAEAATARRHIVRTENDGYAAAVNVGVTAALAAGATAVLLVNDDAVFEEDAVQALCAALRANPKLAAVSAKLIYADRPGVLNGTGGWWDPVHAIARLRGEGEPDAGQYDALTDVDYPSGAASLVRAAAWRDVGPMDEAYYLYYEDVDWGRRALERGWRIGFAGDAVVRHVGSAGTMDAPQRRRYYNVRNRLLFAGTYATARGRSWAALATLVLLLKQPVRYLYRSRRADAEAIGLAVWHHLVGRYGRAAGIG